MLNDYTIAELKELLDANTISYEEYEVASNKASGDIWEYYNEGNDRDGFDT